MFEKAADKCHTDSLSTVVGSCSWGKRVDVGTGSQFELLWNQKETGLDDKEETDVYSFLQMVRSTTKDDAYVSSPGFDVTEEDMAEWAESPERDPALGEPKFEDSAEFQNMHDEGKPSANWEKSLVQDNGCGGGSEWGVSKNTGGEANPQSAWEKTCGGWGTKTKGDDANTTPNWETRPAQTDSIVPENNEPTSNVWGLKSVYDKSWGKRSMETESGY